MAKATHYGTCQVCGRLQALPDGVLAKHGYDVEFHFFRGVCPGAAHKPLELERVFSDEVASSLDRASRAHLRDASAVARGKLLPKHAASGKRIPHERGWGFKDEIVPYADAPEHQQREAVRALEWNLRAQARAEASTAADMRARAHKITGKQPLVERTAEPRKELAPGVKFKLHGHVCTVVRVEDRVAQGCGPYMNGNRMPHVVYTIEGSAKAFAWPARLVRQSSIL